MYSHIRVYLLSLMHMHDTCMKFILINNYLYDVHIMRRIFYYSNNNNIHNNNIAHQDKINIYAMRQMDIQ